MNRQIERLLNELSEEKTNRVEAQRDFEGQLRDMHKELYWQAAKLGAVIGGIVAVAQYLLHWAC